MKAARDFGKQQNFEKMTLEVPGNSPDARHIYEKLGFKVTKEADDTDDFWGGLTEMEYKFNSAKHGALTHHDRLESGKARVSDALKVYGTVNVTGIARFLGWN
jgi:hypothetical protein